MAPASNARGPLYGRRILTTRPSPAGDAQRERFSALGADAVALPCLQLQGPEDPEAFDRRVASVDTYDGVIVSSRAGVDAFAASLSRQGLGPGSLGARLLVAVGRATASACATAGLVPSLIPTEASSEGIVQALADRSMLGQRWVHVRARDGRALLEEAISAAGGRYLLAIGYRAERPPPPPGAIEWIGAGVDAICLHSARTGEHLRDTLNEAVPGRCEEILDRASVASGGPVTTKALQEQGFEVAATAGSPGDDGMVAAVLELLARA